MISVEAALERRYQAPAWALFWNVANGTGVHSYRYADALAMSLFPSRGLDLYGFEIKTDRGDWLRELKNPEKAETIASYCNFWFVVAGSPDVVKKEEVPRKWGLLVQHSKDLRQAKKAEPLEPKPIDRKFLAALLRRAHEFISGAFAKDKAVEVARERGREEGHADVDHDLKVMTRDLSALRRNLEEFESKSGVKIDTWHGGNVGEAVRALMYIQEKDSSRVLDDVAEKIERAAKDLRQKAEAIRKSRMESVP